MSTRLGTTIRLSALLLLAALLVSALSGCSEEASDLNGGEDDFVYDNALFQGVEVFNAAQSGSVNRPNFSWPATNEKHTVCGVFDERISVRNNLITNPEDTVWLWHSGMGRGRDGNVLFEHGARDEGGAPPPSQLSSGTYYWGVWSLDEQGLLVSSTKEYVLSVP